jgi:hypothetical protein
LAETKYKKSREDNSVKRILCIVFVVVLTLGLTACKKDTFYNVGGVDHPTIRTAIGKNLKEFISYTAGREMDHSLLVKEYNSTTPDADAIAYMRYLYDVGYHAGGIDFAAVNLSTVPVRLFSEDGRSIITVSNSTGRVRIEIRRDTNPLERGIW